MWTWEGGWGGREGRTEREMGYWAVKRSIHGLEIDDDDDVVSMMKIPSYSKASGKKPQVHRH